MELVIGFERPIAAMEWLLPKYGYLKQMGPEVQLGSFAFEMLASGLPTLRELRGWSPASEERFVEIVRQMLGEAEDAEARFAADPHRGLRPDDRSGAGGTLGGIDPLPKVVQSVSLNSRGALSIMLVPIAGIDREPAVLPVPGGPVLDRGGRPRFEASYLRHVGIFLNDVREMPPASAWTGILVRRFILHVYARIRAAARRHFEIVEESVLLHDGGDAEPTRLRLATAHQAAEEAAAAAKAAADRERAASVRADAAWLASLPVDGARVASTISAWEKAGCAKKVLFDALSRSGIVLGYPSFPSFVERLRRTLDAERPGWERQGAPALCIFDEPHEAAVAATPGRPSFEASVRHINDRREAKGMDAVPLDRIPRTQQHLRRFARQSGVALPARNEARGRDRSPAPFEDDAP
jgi:hypothetical protein